MAAEGQFLELEKRLAAFKFVFGRLQTSYFKETPVEPFPTSHQIFLDQLINGKINVSNVGAADPDTVVRPARTRTWIKGTHTGTALDTG